MTTLALDDVCLAQPLFSGLEEAPIRDSKESLLAWHSSAKDPRGAALGSGCHADRSTARRIALAEAMERGWVERLRGVDSGREFFLDRFPSSCGFAAGFEREPTRLRSICEAVERWCWSQWVDFGRPIPELGLSDIRLSALAEFFRDFFDELRFFSREIDCPALPGGRARIGITLAISGHGVFPGSRVCSLSEDPWEHSLVEAWRHRLIYGNLGSGSPDDLVLGRISYFGSRAERAFAQIPKPRIENWPEAQVFFSKGITFAGRLFLHRSLCSGYLPWNEGDAMRFMY